MIKQGFNGFSNFHKSLTRPGSFFKAKPFQTFKSSSTKNFSNSLNKNMFGKSSNQPFHKSTFGKNFTQSVHKSKFGNSFNQPVHKGSFGKSFHQPIHKSAFGKSFNQSIHKSTFGKSFNQLAHKSPFGKSFNQLVHKSTFGKGLNQSIHKNPFGKNFNQLVPTTTFEKGLNQSIHKNPFGKNLNLPIHKSTFGKNFNQSDINSKNVYSSLNKPSVTKNIIESIDDQGSVKNIKIQHHHQENRPSTRSRRHLRSGSRVHRQVSASLESLNIRIASSDPGLEGDIPYMNTRELLRMQTLLSWRASEYAGRMLALVNNQLHDVTVMPNNVANHLPPLPQGELARELSQEEIERAESEALEQNRRIEAFGRTVANNPENYTPITDSNRNTIAYRYRIGYTPGSNRPPELEETYDLEGHLLSRQVNGIDPGDLNPEDMVPYGRITRWLVPGGARAIQRAIGSIGPNIGRGARQIRNYIRRSRLTPRLDQMRPGEFEPANSFREANRIYLRLLNRTPEREAAIISHTPNGVNGPIRYYVVQGTNSSVDLTPLSRDFLGVDVSHLNVVAHAHPFYPLNEIRSNPLLTTHLMRHPSGITGDLGVFLRRAQHTGRAVRTRIHYRVPSDRVLRKNRDLRNAPWGATDIIVYPEGHVHIWFRNGQQNFRTRYSDLESAQSALNDIKAGIVPNQFPIGVPARPPRENPYPSR